MTSINGPDDIQKFTGRWTSGLFGAFVGGAAGFLLALAVNNFSGLIKLCSW